MKAGCAEQKATAGRRSPAISRVPSDTQEEHILTYIIWLYFDVACSLNSFSCIVDVRPSKRRNANSSRKPCMLLPVALFDAMGPVIRKLVTPNVTQRATSQSWRP